MMKRRWPLIVLAALGAWLVGGYGVIGAAISLIVAQFVGSATRVIALLYTSRIEQVHETPIASPPSSAAEVAA